MEANLVNAVEVVENYHVTNIQQAIDSVIEQGAISVVLLCCDTQEDFSAINALLTSYSISIIGGVFPGVIWQEHVIKSGCLVIGLCTPIRYQIHYNISHKVNCTPSLSLNPNEALLVFIDGLSKSIESCIQTLYDWVGNDHQVIGAGAGSLTLQQKPCVLCNKGIFEDAMLVATLPVQLNISIAHGWQQLAGPFLATSVDGNTVKEINYQPAFDVYKNNILQHHEIDITEQNFFQHASTFPLGIDRLDDDMLIRDPIKVEGDGIVCVGAVPENSMLFILCGDKNSLIESVANATEKVNTATDVAFVVDCISRQLFLQDQFEHEIDVIRNGIAPFNQFIAILGLGEIASGKYGAINFHNKTSVIGSLTSSKEAHCNM